VEDGTPAFDPPLSTISPNTRAIVAQEIPMASWMSRRSRASSARSSRMAIRFSDRIRYSASSRGVFMYHILRVAE
jgi:hypothetical protein